MGYLWGKPTFAQGSRLKLGPGKDTKFRIKSITPYYMQYMQPLKKYLNFLVWDTCPESEGVTFLEMVVDFELATGCRLTHPIHGFKTAWNIKAEMFKKLYGYIINEHKFFKGPKIGREIRSLNPFFGPTKRLIGLVYRPKFMINEGTELNIAMNLHEYLVAGGQVAATRPGVVNHIITYIHTGIYKPVVKDPDEGAMLDELSRYIKPIRRRLNGKQRPI